MPESPTSQCLPVATIEADSFPAFWAETKSDVDRLG